MNRLSSQAESPESFSEVADATAKRPGVFGKLLVISLIVVSIAVTAFVGYVIVNNVGTKNYISADEYQAVFLSDGQIYFGKLSGVDKQYAVLENIYYLQVQDAEGRPVQQGADSAEQVPQIKLVKLGNEIHGPQDKMIINTDQILFWENLKESGQVAEAIAGYEARGADTTTQQDADSNE